MNRTKRGAFRPLFVSKISTGSKLFLLVLVVLVYANLYRIAPGIVAAQPMWQPTITTASESESNPVIPAGVLAALTQAQTNDTTINATCSATTPSYAEPGPLSLSSDSPLLTKVIDSPSYYRVYGDKVSALRASIDSCPIRFAAAGPYHAITARSINWSYGISQSSDGVCEMQDTHIGLHVSQLLPYFSPTELTASYTVAAWSSYATSLAKHEQGHINLAVEHSDRLAASLQAVGPMRCDMLSTHVDTMINTAITTLDSEDELYDAQTKHGATQGAVL